MEITSFDDIKNMGYAQDTETSIIKLDGGDGEVHDIKVKHYLPIEEKSKFVSYVVNSALDLGTGCFSPIRLNVYYDIAIMKFYCGVTFNDDSILEAYDILESTKIIDRVLSVIPEDERGFIEHLVADTTTDIARYNNSFAGIMASMNTDASNLDSSLQSILEKIKNREGLEMLSEIKNVVGTD